jgi:hypothetical protein
MTPRIRILVSATFLLGACAFVQAAPPPPRPAGTPTTWTVSINVVGPASLVGHGTALPVSQVVNEGDTATVTITPDPGYVMTSLDDYDCGGTANGDGTWTTDPILGDCTITATFALSASDVVFQSDLDPDIKVFDDVNLDLPQTWLGASINWQTGATCTGTNAAPCDNSYHFRPAADYDFVDPVLVFRYPTNDDWALDDSMRSNGLVGYTNDQDEDFSPPLNSGATIGPEQTFVFPVLKFETAPWHTAAGLDAYVGFRFLNSDTGLINYGYAHLVSSPQNTPTPTGFPATIVGFAYNRRGAPITIP